MKRNKFLIMTVLAAVTGLTACSNDDDTSRESSYPADGVVRVSAGVSGMATRAYTTDNLTEFGISITNSENTAYTYDNVQVTGSSMVGWTTAKQMLWQNRSTPVSIVAYAPYNNSATIATGDKYRVKVKADQSTEANLNASDFLTFKNSTFTPSTDLNDGKVDIAFYHALSQVKLNITLGTEFNKPSIPTENPISNLTVNGTVLSTACDFTQETPTLAAVSGTSAGVQPYASDYTPVTSETDNVTVSYECILIPQTVTAGTFSVTFTLGNNTYEWTSADDVTLAGGTSYTLDLTVGNDVVTVSSISAKKWSSSSSTTINATATEEEQNISEED